MDKEIVDFAAVLWIIKNDPTFSSVIECIPAMILTTVGGVAETLTGTRSISARGIMGGFFLTPVVGIVAKTVLDYLEVQPAYFACCCVILGYMSSKRWLLDNLIKVVVARVINDVKNKLGK
jgi:hypothetical protein